MSTLNVCVVMYISDENAIHIEGWMKRRLSLDVRHTVARRGADHTILKIIGRPKTNYNWPVTINNDRSTRKTAKNWANIRSTVDRPSATGR